MLVLIQVSVYSVCHQNHQRVSIRITMVSLRVRVKVTTTISSRVPKVQAPFLKLPGCLLVFLYLLLAQRLPSTPRICFPHPAMLPVQGVVRTKCDVSEK